MVSMLKNYLCRPYCHIVIVAVSSVVIVDISFDTHYVDIYINVVCVAIVIVIAPAPSIMSCVHGGIQAE